MQIPSIAQTLAISLISNVVQVLAPAGSGNYYNKFQQIFQQSKLFSTVVSNVTNILDAGLTFVVGDASPLNS